MKTFITALFAGMAAAQALPEEDQAFKKLTIEQWLAHEWQNDFCEAFVPLPSVEDSGDFDTTTVPFGADVFNRGRYDARKDNVTGLVELLPIDDGDIR